MRITTSMVQRNVLADLNNISSKLTHSQMKASSGKEITRPSDDPFNAARAMALRQSMNGTRQQQRNVQDAQGWTESTDQALSSISKAIQDARDLVLQGGTDSTDQTSRNAIASQIDELIESVKQNANATYRGSFLFSGGETATRPYEPGVDDTYQGDDAGYPASGIPGIAREIGPGVTMTINIVGRQVLGQGPDSLLAVLRDTAQHLRAGDSASVRGTDLARLDTNFENVLDVWAGNGARAVRLDTALLRLGEVEEATVAQLSETEDADIAKTIIDLNSQQAAYQAALRAGASIVQSSLMDFLR